MKNIIFTISLVLGLFAFVVSCQKTYTLGPLATNMVPTPTNTPSFNQCTPTAMLTPNPWSGTVTALVVPPSYSGNADIRLQVYDSTYTKVKDLTFPLVPPSVGLNITPVNIQATPLPNGNYYLKLTVSPVFGGGPTICYYDTFVRN